MSGTFHIQVATPEKLLVDAEAMSAQIPTRNGYIGVLAGHAALLSELGSDELSYLTPANETRTLRVNGGYLEILDDRVRILTLPAAEA
jgi:F-type H+-transporting ATPase subunit epsilon